jgi:hypothetical protein
MRHRSIALLLLLVALVAAGCGGDDSGDKKTTSKQQYGTELAQAGKTLQSTFADIADQTTGANTSSKEIGSRLQKGADALDGAVAKFAAITPPADLKSAHDKLVAGLREVAQVFHKGADAAAKSDTKALSTALQGLSTGDGVKKITEAQQELKAKGVTTTTPDGK